MKSSSSGFLVIAESSELVSGFMFWTIKDRQSRLDTLLVVVVPKKQWEISYFSRKKLSKYLYWHVKQGEISHFLIVKNPKQFLLTCKTRRNQSFSYRKKIQKYFYCHRKQGEIRHFPIAKTLNYFFWYRKHWEISHFPREK